MLRPYSASDDRQHSRCRRAEAHQSTAWGRVTSKAVGPLVPTGRRAPATTPSQQPRMTVYSMSTRALASVVLYRAPCSSHLISESPMNQSTPMPALVAAHVVARKLSSNRTEREDLASVALLGLLEHANRHAIDIDVALSEPHWRVLQCRAMDRVRTQSRRRMGWQQLAASYVEPRLQTAPMRDRIDLGSAIARASDELDAREKLVLERVYVAGETLADVARDQGWSHPAARRRHSRLLRALRSSLCEADPADGSRAGATAPHGAGDGCHP